jgi:hypothetical protein
MSIVGAWLVSHSLGGTPKPLGRQHINPLAAESVAVFTADGLLTVSLSPAYPVPDQAISATQLLVGTAAGSWTATDDGRITARCAAVLRNERGSAVATLFLDAAIDLDTDADTFSGAYTIEPHLTRAWVRNLPKLDGSVQGWRIESATT